MNQPDVLSWNLSTVFKRLLIGSVTFWLASSSALLADNWPQWRGPNNDGIATVKSAPTHWDHEKNVLWRTPLPGQGGATPAIWGDKIFVSSADGDDLVLLCLSTLDGKQLWRKHVGSGNKDARAGEGNSASPSPATDGQHVWIFFSTGILACFDMDGNQVWKLNCNEQFGEIDIQFGLTSTPVLNGDSLYLQLIHGRMDRNSDQRTGKVVKLNKLTGKTIWQYDRVTQAEFECKHSYSSPLMASDGRRNFLIVHGADCTTAHDLETGKELWRLVDLNGPTDLNPKRTDFTFRFVASPVFAKGHLIIPTAKEGPTVSLPLSASLNGTINQKQASWILPQTPDVSIPLVVDDLVYLLHKDGKLQCVELATGNEVYHERTHSVQHRTSPVYADGKIYYCAKDGVCTVVKAGRTFEVISSNTMAGEPITASPVFCDETLYLRTYQALYAIRN